MDRTIKKTRELQSRSMRLLWPSGFARLGGRGEMYIYNIKWRTWEHSGKKDLESRSLISFVVLWSFLIKFHSIGNMVSCLLLYVIYEHFPPFPKPCESARP